jgi:hypothetical protein
VPLVAFATNKIVEIMGKQFVDAQREQTRVRQRTLLSESLAEPLCDWLTKWPSTGGSAFERLQLALRRLPADVRRLSEYVALRLNPPEPVAAAG